jgi:hypothetical protein
MKRVMARREEEKEKRMYSQKRRVEEKGRV